MSDFHIDKIVLGNRGDKIRIGCKCCNNSAHANPESLKRWINKEKPISGQIVERVPTMEEVRNEVSRSRIPEDYKIREIYKATLKLMNLEEPK